MPTRTATDPEGTGGGPPPPIVSPSRRALNWLLAIRLIVTTTFFLGALIIQAATGVILPLSGFYSLVLLTYGLSLFYVVLPKLKLSDTAQAVIQLLGDIGIVTGFVYVTGGLYSPFSFLYLTVIIVAAVMLRGGGLIFAGLSTIAYGFLVDLMVFRLVPLPPNLVGEQLTIPTSRILLQLLIHVAGFLLVAVLVSYLSESLRTTYVRLDEERERASQFAALTQHVIQSVGSGILAADMEGRVLHVNPAGAGILGVAEPDSVAGKPVEVVMPMEGLRWPALLGNAAAPSPRRVEGTLRTSRRRLGFTVGPLSDGTGNQVGFVVNFQDLSEVEQTRRREQLRDRMATLGEMTVRVAHEIKNPLASISGSAQMLARKDEDDPTVHQLLRIIVDESRRLSKIVDGFLDSARPHELRKRPVDLVALLRDHVDLLRRTEGLAGPSEIRLDAPDSLTVDADEHLLQQVFWNLSRNSLEAMPDGGSLHISVVQEGGSAVLRWIDNGTGMAEDLRSRAFEPFVTTRSDGTGLGLAVVYTLVDEHEGSVEIDSRPGEGTTVTVELPYGRRVK